MKVFWSKGLGGGFRVGSAFGGGRRSGGGGLVLLILVVWLIVKGCS